MRLNSWVVRRVKVNRSILVLTTSHRLRQVFCAYRLSLACFIAVALFFSQETNASSSDTHVFLAPINEVDISNRLFADEVQADISSKQWEKSESMDSDLIEAGVDNLGELLKTGWFDKNKQDGAVKRLYENKEGNQI